MTVRETFELDWSQALRGADQLDRALGQASSRFHTAISRALSQLDATVKVSADAKAVTGAITAAVETADSNVEVTAEASPVTGAIDAAVENADTHVEITGDASQLTGAVDAALADAKKSSSEVSDNIGGAASNAGLLAGGLLKSGQNMALLAKGAGAAAVGLFFKSAVDAASDLTESLNKARAVFRDASKEVEGFAKTSADSIGLSQQAALEALGTFGNLFNALGSTRREAAGMSVDVLTLAADLTSFNNPAGGLNETLERLRSGLVGEIEPLRRLGISFNAAQVEAKAMELGLASANGEVSEGAKVQARLALITEQSKNAAGDFARTSEDLANKQRRTTAEWQNAQAALGEGLKPALSGVLDIARSGISIIGELSGVFKVLGEAVRISLLPISAPLHLIANGFQGVEESVNTLEGTLDKLAKNATDASFKKLAGSFDEIATAAASGIFFGDKYNSTLDVFRSIANRDVDAATRLRDALIDNGVSGKELAAINDILDKAIGRAAKGMKDMKPPTDAVTRSFEEQLAAAEDLVNSQLDMEDALFNLEDAQTKYNDALRNGNPGEVARALNDLERAALAVGEETRNATIAQSLFKDENARTAEGVQAQIGRLGALAATLAEGSPLRVFLEGYIGQLQRTQGTFVATVRVDAGNALFVLEQLRLAGGFALDPFSFIINPDTTSTVPHAASGGFVAQSGVAVIHKGETIVPAGEGTTIEFNINVAGVTDPGVGRAVGRQIGNGAADALARRGVVVAARTGGG